MKSIDVSIVIVCMNNLKNLYPCLESIRKYTSVSYECFVVAYLFSSDNLMKVKKDFPWVKFIESNEIRGFSENNNLALRQAKGKYCFVVNDDTEMKMDVITSLLQAFKILPTNTCIVSPQIIVGGKQFKLLGKPKYNFYSLFLNNIGLGQWLHNRSKYTNKNGVFQTFNISGAAFLIKTNIFKEVGWFDEKYFFCPEDIALSTQLNKMGYGIYVNSKAIIYHYSGGTWSSTITATKPAAVKGEYMFYCNSNVAKRILFIIFFSCIHLAKTIYWMTFCINKNINKSKIMKEANLNAIRALFSISTPKELFIKYYKKNN